ncbi:MAG: hypothetical protein ACK6DP_11040 [Gemmatimonas sp.]|uniref:hypothetical protein n=1 Tax=Gemmatimonas sp. TaxID=1962908 RepID=UPI00391FC82B
MKAPTAIRSADLLAIFDLLPTAPLRQREIAAALAVPSVKLSGHIWHLRRVGKIERVSRGTYRRKGGVP